MSVIEKIFGTYSAKEIKKITPILNNINDLEEKMEKLSDEDIKNKTEEFKKRLSDGEELNHILPEAYALVREASKRVLGQRHFDVQIIGGIILHQGRIAEMKTGEGKTLTVTLPAYLNALTGKGVHIVTVNDYLASFHSAWMGKLYKFLGLTVGLVIQGMDPLKKKAAYDADITYGTNNEFGFDYLRDNMCMSKEEMVQRDLTYAVVDEVDSILIDEARTPLIISGMGNQSTQLYQKTNDLIKRFSARVIVEKDDKEFDSQDEDFDYVVDLKSRATTLTEKGTKKCEQYFGIDSLTDVANMEILHHINQALKAYGIMKKDIDYIVKDDEILIVDEFTGRIMQGRRYSEGLHQAIEAKENVTIAHESKTLATITFQNYFRLYTKLAGMTGTAKSEETEFKGIFGLDVVEIPTNMPTIRIDKNDVVYKTEMGKFKAIVEDVKECYKKGQPVLVGTVSIEKSELLSSMLKNEKIPHEVLNAKYHAKEAEIIAQAGKYKTVTIATNMAGRGTDILLGGNPEFLAKQQLEKSGASIEEIEIASSPFPTTNPNILCLREKYLSKEKEFKEILKQEKEKVIAVGGLKIIGSERHESRRIDNQLRGRSGRQGDPGESRFYISLEDDLMKLFGSEKVMTIANMMGLPEDMPIEQKMLTGAIETAQKRVEGKNYSIRKNVLEYDDVMNKQRDIIYNQRRQLLNNESIQDKIINLTKSKINKAVLENNIHEGKKQRLDIERVNLALNNFFAIHDFIKLEDVNNLTAENISEKLCNEITDIYLSKREEFKENSLEEMYNQLERFIMLKIVDEKWQSHIDNMSHLKEGIGLRAYGQSNPIDAYKIESFDLFNDMTTSIQEETLRAIYGLKYKEENRETDIIKKLKQTKNRANKFEKTNINVYNTNEIQNEEVKRQPIRVEKQVGRNEPCPCGSGRKYKQCCGK